MANVVNRATRELRLSVNTPDFPTAQWIINPDLSAFNAIGGYQARYAEISGDDVLLLSASERQQADNADRDTRIANSRTSALNALDRLIEESAPITVAHIGLLLRELIELLNKRDNYVINRVEELQTTFDDIKATSGPADNIRAAIPSSFLATNTRSRKEAIDVFKSEISSGLADGNLNFTIPNGDLGLTGQTPTVT